MWATVIAKTAKYLVWVKSNQHRVSLTVVLFVFPHPPHPYPPCEICPAFAWDCSPMSEPPWLPLAGEAEEGQHSL